jgi:myo-inositol 2-dehydrogenase/D-chiro-inositol 1-dehydrogenase
VLVNLRFADGGIGTVEVSWAYPASIPFDSATELIGTEASVSWTYADTASLVVADGETREAIANDAGSFVEEVAAFARAAHDGAPSPVPGSDGMAALRVALAAMHSLDTGETVELAPAGAAR